MAKPATFHLGAKNVVTAPEELLRMLFLQAYTATAQQGRGLGKVFSFQYLSGMYGNKPKEFLDQLEEQFGQYLLDYFPEGAVVTAIEENEGEDARYTVRLTARVTYEGDVYHLAEVLRIDPDNTVKRIQDAL